jgi:nucleotide-binding universal stress UspA family protein
MLHRILAPTDGSAESEKALTYAEQIAVAHGAEVVLAFILDPSSNAASAGQDAATHLANIEQRLQAAGVRTRSIVERGPVAATLLERERLEQPDLLVIATHGRTGLARARLGSVADRMVREGSAPVLVVRRAAAPSNRLQSAIVLLDGSSFGEGALAMAGQLAGQPVRSITLCQVVANAADRSEAERFLQSAARQIATDGVEVTTAVEAGDLREVIVRAASDHDITLLSTHGRGGFDRLRHGSVADYVVRYLEQPVLLVRATERPEYAAYGDRGPSSSEELEATERAVFPLEPGPHQRS